MLRIGSPRSSMREGTESIDQRVGVSVAFTSSQSSGVETVAPSWARTESGATMVRERPVCPVSMSTR
jgi:hypothetical protein